MSLEEITEPLPGVHTSTIDSSKDNSPASFLLNLTKLNIYIGLQSVLDALDIWLSAVKYVFDALNPSSGNRSTAQMYQWLHTSDGLLIFIIGNIVFAIFAFLGNYVDTKKEGKKPWIVNEFAKLAENTWPYIRDCFKGLKWTFKGTRSFLLVSQVILDQNLIHLITPLGILLGLVAASNRAWARGMVERRKTIQSNNDLFREHVKFVNAAFSEVNEEWRSNFQYLDHNFKEIYQGCVLRIGNASYVVNQKLELTRISNLSKQGQQFLQDLILDATTQKMDFYHYKKHISKLNEPDKAILTAILNDKKKYLEMISDKENGKQFYDFPQCQSDSYQSYASSLLNGILNSPYYFLGVISLFLDVIPAAVFPYAIAICCMYMVLNIAAELYQEFDYQRRLSISQNKAKLSMIKRLISYEWDKINQIIDEAVESKQRQTNVALFKDIFYAEIGKLSSEQNMHSSAIDLGRYLSDTPCRSEVLPELSKEQREKFIACLKQLNRYSKDFADYKQILTENLVLDRQSTFMQGIKNGLHIYGVFNGCLMAIATMAFLAGGSLGITFLYISIAAGITFITLSVIFTMLLTQNNAPLNSEPEHINVTAQSQRPQQVENELVFWAHEHDVDIFVDERDIQPTKNLMISEQCEVFRQFMSGSKKGVKLLQTVLMLTLGTSGETELPIKALYGLFALTYGGLFSLKGLRGLMRVDNQDYEKSLLVGGFFSKQETDAKTGALSLRTSRSCTSFHSALAVAPL